LKENLWREIVKISR